MRNFYFVMRFSRLVVHIFCALTLVVHSGAQRLREQSAQYAQPGPAIAIQTTSLVSNEPGMRRLDIGYRIPKSFFVFTRDTSSADEHAFLAQGEILVEILDTTKASVARCFISKRISASEAPTPSPDTASVAGGCSFNILPGSYSVSIEVVDKNSDRKFRDVSKKLTLKDFSRSALELCDPIFFKLPDDPNPNLLIPFNIGGDIPFGEKARCYIPVFATVPKESIQIGFRLTMLNPDGGIGTPVIIDSLSSEALGPAHLFRMVNADDSFAYSVIDSSLRDAYACVITIDADTLRQGSYELQVVARSGSSLSTIKKNVQLRWLTMPASLRQLRFAVEAMEYLLPEKEFNQLRSSNPKEQRKEFDEYWTKRDPTPHTAFNEVMAEYFKRVDYAFTAFGTIGQRNGIKTERGKAYILYGPPFSIERKLVPSSDPQEIWLYENLRKRLTFVDEHRNGNYRLISAETF